MQKQTWDTRAWIIGIVGGAVGGSIASWSVFRSVQTWLDRLPHFAWFGSTNGEMTSGILGIGTAVFLPGILSGIARRRTFLWGMIPLVLFLTARDIGDWIENGTHIMASNPWFTLLMAGLCLGVSSGPVSLIRWLRVRAARHHAAMLASYRTQREAASVPRDGVWPPPPEYRE